MTVGRKGWASRVPRALAAAAAAMLLMAACGGGDQVDPFVASRVLAFGDETSVITDPVVDEATGTTTTPARKYTVDFASADEAGAVTRDCSQNPLWIQIVAGRYGLSFPQCPGIADAAASRILAVPGADVAGLRAQIDAFLAGGGSFAGDDLVTVLVGANDLRALHQAVAAGTLSADEAVAQAQATGRELAAQVNRMAALGAKVLVSTVENQVFTPLGRADAAQATLLQRMSVEFNSRMRTGLVNDGRLIGLVLFDEAVQAIVNSESFNTTEAACNDATVADVLTCDGLTLRAGASIDSWLWADDRHIAPLGHSTLGSIAVNRAINNPF